MHSALEACKSKEAIVIATEWKEFREIDWQTVYDDMTKPAFVFDGRLLVDADKLRQIGFKVCASAFISEPSLTRWGYTGQGHRSRREALSTHSFLFSHLLWTTLDHRRAVKMRAHNHLSARLCRYHIHYIERNSFIC